MHTANSARTLRNASCLCSPAAMSTCTTSTPSLSGPPSSCKYLQEEKTWRLRTEAVPRVCATQLGTVAARCASHQLAAATTRGARERTTPLFCHGLRGASTASSEGCQRPHSNALLAARGDSFVSVPRTRSETRAGLATVEAHSAWDGAIGSRRGEMCVMSSRGLSRLPCAWATRRCVKGASHGSISSGIHRCHAPLVRQTCCRWTCGEQEAHSLRVALGSWTRRVRCQATHPLKRWQCGGLAAGDTPARMPCAAPSRHRRPAAPRPLHAPTWRSGHTTGMGEQSYMARAGRHRLRALTVLCTRPRGRNTRPGAAPSRPQPPCDGSHQRLAAKQCENHE